MAMPNQEFKKLLVKLGIDTSSWQSAIKDIKKSLEQINAEEQKRAVAQKRDSQTLTDQTRQAAAAVKQLQAETRAVAAQKQALIQQERLLQEQIRTTIEQEKRKTAELRAQQTQAAATAASQLQASRQVAAELSAQTALKRQLSEQERLNQEQIQTGIAQEKLKAAEIQHQIALSRQVIAATQADLVQRSSVIQQRRLEQEQARLAVLLEQQKTAEMRRQAASVVAYRQAAAAAAQHLQAEARAQIAQKQALAQQERILQAQAQTSISQARQKTAEIQKQSAQQTLQARAAAASAAQERAATQANIGQKRAQIEQERLLQSQVQAAVAQERLKTAELQRQNAELRLQVAQQREAERQSRMRTQAGAPSGFAGGLFGGLTSRLAGTITFAIVSADMLRRGFERLFQTTKSFIESSGPLIQLREQFEKLASIKGYDTLEFFRQLQTATRGLVEDIPIYRLANQVLQSGVSATQDQVVQLTRAVVELARANGRDVTTALEGLNRGFATGRFTMLSYTLGTSSLQRGLRTIPDNLDAVTRKNLEFSKTLQILTEQLQRTGSPALTYTERLRQLSIGFHNVIEEIARSAATSGGMKLFIDILGQVVDGMASVHGGATRLGNAIGEFFGTMAAGAQALIGVARLGITILLDVRDRAMEVGRALFGALGPEAAAKIRPGVDGTIVRLTTISGLLKTAAGAAFMLRAGLEQLYAITTKTGIGTGGPSGLDALSFIYHGYTDPDNKVGKLREELARLEAQAKRYADGSKEIPRGLRVQIEMQRESIKNWESMQDALRRSNDTMMESLQALEAGFTRPGYTAQPPGTGAEQSEDIAAQLQQRAQMEKLKLDLQKQQGKVRLEQTRTQIQEERSALDESYQSGLVTFSAYLEKRRELLKREHEAKLAELEAERRAAEKEISLELDARSSLIHQYKSQIRSLDEQQQKILTTQKPSEPLSTDTRMQLADLTAARTTAAAGLAQAETALSGTREMYRLRKQIVTEGAAAAVEAEMRAYAAGQIELDKLQFKDTRDAARATQQFELQATLETLRLKRDLLQDSLSKNRTLVADYIEQVKALNQDELQAFIRSEAQKAATSADSATARVNMLAAVMRKQQEIADAEKKLEAQRPDMMFREQQTSLERQLRLIEAQRQLMQLPGVGRVLYGQQVPGFGDIFRELGGKPASGDQKALLAQYEEAIRRLIESIRQRLSELASQGLEGADEWLELTQRVIQYEQAIIRARNETQTFGDIAANALQQLAQTVSNLGGRVGELGRGIGVAARIQTALTQFARTAATLRIGAREAVPQPIPDTRIPGSFITLPGIERPATPVTLNPITGLGRSLEDLFNSIRNRGKGFTESLQKFSVSLGTAVEAVGGFVNSVQGIGGPVQAGLSGAVSGVSLGGALEKTIGKMGSIGAALGPWGAAIGAGVGLIVGTFTGAKRRATERIAREIQNSFNAIIQKFQTQSLTLAQALDQTIQQRANAIAQLSGRKGGQDELNRILPEMDRVITELRTQQTRIFQAFSQTYALLRAPEPYREHIQNLENIIQKYREYVQAGGDLVQANDYLRLSLQQLAKEGLDTLTDRQSQAIQDALQYNELLESRQNLLDSTNKQIQNLLSQGAVTRQRPRALQVAEQIAELEKERDKQLRRIDLEAQVAKHKLDAERQIFSLSTDRVALEQRLVQMQQAQIDKDLERLRTLQQVVGMLQSNPNLLSLIEAQTRTSPVGYASAQMIEALVSALRSISGGGTSIEAMLAALYQQRSRYGESGFAQDSLGSF